VSGGAAVRLPALAAVAGLAVLLLGTSLFASTRRGLWDPDEPRYAEVAREMLEARDVPHFLVPHLGGREYTAKPPLLFWLEAASAQTTGGELTPVSARLPSVLAGLVVLLATAALGWRLLGPRGAVAACLALLAQGQFVWQSSFGQIDQLLAAFEVSGIACIVLASYPEEAGDEPRPRKGLAALGLALLGLGVLAKGPVSVLVPLLGLAPLFATRRPKLGRAWLGLAVGLLPALAWFVAAAATGSSQYAATIGWRETVVRYFSAQAHQMSAPRLWGEFLAGVLPVSVFLVPALGEAIRAERHALRYGAPIGDRLGTLLPIAWLFASVVFFSFSHGKRSVYFVPTYPAVALLIGWYAARPRESIHRVWLEVEHFTGWLFLIVAALIVPAVEIGEGFVPWIDWEIAPLDLRPEAYLLAAALGAAGVLAVLRSRAWLPALGLSTLVVFFALHVRVVPDFDPAKSAERAATRFLAVMPPGSEWAMIGEEQEGIQFYSRKRIDDFPLNDAGINGLHAWFKERAGKPAFLIVKEGDNAPVLEHFPELKEIVRARIGQSVFLLKKPKAD
jgi:4-amino-4-deoxy-L-arabinose transferase-like glycosyltransferase